MCDTVANLHALASRPLSLSSSSSSSAVADAAPWNLQATGTTTAGIAVPVVTIPNAAPALRNGIPRFGYPYDVSQVLSGGSAATDYLMGVGLQAAYGAETWNLSGRSGVFACFHV